MIQACHRYMYYKTTQNYSSSLLEIDECSSPETNDCDLNAMCTNTEGSYVCRCKRGFEGDGKNCSGKMSCLAVVLDAKCLLKWSVDFQAQTDCHRNDLKQVVLKIL